MNNVLQQPSQRVVSIDIVRGLTLFLMLFVNDLYMPGVPAWMGHMAADTDGMGLADWVFPSFLFMVGMSVPYAIAARYRRGDNAWRILLHILWRTFSLILIGVSLLNASRLNPEMTGMSSGTWSMLFYLFLFLFWNSYPRNSRYGVLFKTLRAVGGIGIALLLAIFRAGTPEDPSWLVPSWWGILGLIGWGYLAAAVISLVTRGRLWGAVAGWLFFLILNILSSLGLMHFADCLQPVIGTLIQGNTPMIVLAGMTLGTFIKESSADNRRKTLVILAAGVVSLALGFFLRQWFIISKIYATPSWGLICNGISMILLSLVFWRTDVCGKTRGTSLLTAAGRNSMTTYIAPSVVYHLIWLCPFHILFYKQPDSAALAIIGSLAWSFVMVLMAMGLEKLHIKLKL